MTTPVDLGDYLTELRTQVCGPYQAGWADCIGCAPLGRVCTGDPSSVQGIPACAGRGEPPEAYRARIREMRCKQCVFLLLLQAIDQLIPAERIPAWMEAPNEDLGGATPLGCISSGHFEQVFEPLWLLSEPGPSS